MPKSKKSKKYSRKRRRTMPWYNRPINYSVSDIATAAYNGVKYLKGMINSEKHYFDVTGSGNVDTTGSVNLLTGVAQGDDVNNRNGNSILGKTIFLRVLLTRVAANTNPVNFCRILVVKDMENTGTDPAISDILASATTISPLNVDHTSRYQVLADRVVPLSANGREGSQHKFYIRVNDHVKYTGSGGAAIYKNQIYMMLIGDQATNAPSWSSYSRFGFYDN